MGSTFQDQIVCRSQISTQGHSSSTVKNWTTAVITIIGKCTDPRECQLRFTKKLRVRAEPRMNSCRVDHPCAGGRRLSACCPAASKGFPGNRESQHCIMNHQSRIEVIEALRAQGSIILKPQRE
ncbi:hypothetical protein BJX70DRAFT_353223 [Aspergillus crustosus]